MHVFTHLNRFSSQGFYLIFYIEIRVIFTSVFLLIDIKISNYFNWSRKEGNGGNFENPFCRKPLLQQDSTLLGTYEFQSLWKWWQTITNAQNFEQPTHIFLYRTRIDTSDSGELSSQFPLQLHTHTHADIRCISKFSACWKVAHYNL